MRLLSSATVRGIAGHVSGPNPHASHSSVPQKVANASNVCSPFASYEALVAPLELKMRHGGLSVQERVRRGQWGATTTGAR